MRIGITGKRVLTEAQTAAAEARLRCVLDFVQSEVTRFATCAPTLAAYSTATPDQAKPRVEFISPLAEGADRLAARVARSLGYTLHTPMPFHQSEYEQDFRGDTDRGIADTTQAFRDLLPADEAARLELDGGRQHAGDNSYDEARSYEAVGRYVVRNADLLIAIWDGAPPTGWGGTAEIVRFALETGTPVWWIHTDPAREPKWLELPQEMHPDAKTPPALDALRVWLERVIVPPRIDHAGHHGSALGWIAAATRRLLKREPRDPLVAYLSDPQPMHERPWVWKAHAWLIRFVARYGFATPRDKRPQDDPVAGAWFDLYQAADARSNEYAARYRSSYVWIFLFAGLSLICVAASLAFQENAYVEVIAIIAEITSLLLILGLIVANITSDWHQRWIDYRLLAELCRKQQALAPLGWSLPGQFMETIADHEVEATMRDEPIEPDRTAWVAWLFAAYRRATPLPHGRFDKARFERCHRAVQQDLVRVQTCYHTGRAKQSSRAGQCLVLLGEGLFALVLIAVLIKLWLLATHGEHTLIVAFGLVASIAPAVAATSIGIRAYAELEALAHQSEHMRRAMQRLDARLDGMLSDADRPLVSQDLGAVTLDVATTMLQDIDGWARLFRVKVVEAG